MNPIATIWTTPGVSEFIAAIFGALPASGAIIIPQNQPAKPLTGQPAQNSHAEQNPIKAFLNHTVSEPVSVFTLALVGSTILLWRATLRIARDSKQSAEIQADKMERSIGEAVAATKAMRESNEIAREAMQKQLRAYVTIEPEGINEAGDDGRARVPVLVKNVGETPAHKLMVFSKFTLDANPRDFDPSKLQGTDAWLKGEINDATLGRNDHRFIFPYIDAGFLKEHGNDIAKKRMAIIHFGNVTYDDVFDETHRTNFAFYHWGEELSDTNALRCRFGNTAD